MKTGKLLYIDAVGGVAGDMLCGALLDLGWPIAEAGKLVADLGMPGVSVAEECLERNHLACRRLDVRFEHDQPHRHLPHILELLDKLPAATAEPAKKVFSVLGRAEAKVHGVAIEKIHFHEVGAVDAIVEIAAFCAGLAWLGVGKVIASPLPLGRGFTKAAHGRLPLPAPAVLNILAGAPVTEWPAPEETVTPTGAALVAGLAEEYGGLPSMRLLGTGMGSGSRQSEAGPNIVRLLLGEGSGGEHAQVGSVVELVSHIDDMTPEDLAMAAERLFAEGALDVAYSPLFMKKGRPGWEIKVIARPHQADFLAHMLLAQTSAIGLRQRMCHRAVLPRQGMTVETPWGQARVKKIGLGEETRFTPEADDVAAICKKTGLPPSKVRAKIAALAEEA